jgi:putative salt-induced outer membrane protein YdiY
MHIRGPLLGVVVVAAAGLVRADDPCAPTPSPTPRALTASLGAGLAKTGGNTDTLTLNATFGLQWDPKTGKVLKASGSYLRGSTDGLETVDQTALNLRGERRLSARAFLFAEVGYLRDRFKELTYLLTPAVGAGYKLVATDATLLAVDAGLGGAFEKDTDRQSTSGGAFQAGQTFSHKLSPTATFAQSARGIWKTSDTSDALYHLDVSLAAALTGRTEIKVSFVDDIKTRRASPGVARSDTAVMMTLVMKM